MIRNANVETIRMLGHQMHQLRSGPKADFRQQVRTCLERADIKPGTISIALCLDQTAELFDVKPHCLNPDMLTFASSFQLRKRGVETKLIIGDATKVSVDTVLIRNIALAHAIYENLKSGKNIETTAAEVGLSKRRILQLINHAFLSPQITKSILEGRQPLALTTEWLQHNQVPACWNEQTSLFATL